MSSATVASWPLRVSLGVALAGALLGCSDGDTGNSGGGGVAADVADTSSGGFQFDATADAGGSADGNGGAGLDDATPAPDGANQDDANQDGAGPGQDTAVISPNAPARNPACESPPLDAHGEVVPWAGFVFKGTSFSCNLCPGGDPLVQGTWRAVNGETRDPATPLSGGFRERVIIDGNTWQVRDDADSEPDTTARGWYFCTDKEELGSQRVVFVTTDVDPEGGFGWSSDAVFTGQFLLNGPNRLMWQAYEGFETGAYADYLYCRVGSTVDGSPCEDPFDS